MPVAAGALAAAALLGGSARAQDVRLAFAPYVHMIPGVDLASWVRATGQHDVTLAFFNAAGGRCEGAWPQDEAAVLAQARRIRALGGDVIVSSGGWNADDLAARCATPQALAEVYDRVLQRFGADHLDLDAEPGDIHDNLAPAMVDRRSAALRLLQDRFEARGRPLHLSFTVAVRPAFGLDPANLYVVRSALAAGLTIDVLNAMVMDYRDGQSAGRMGARSIQAVERMKAQLAALVPGVSEAEYWGVIAATPMIGQNDAEPEVFTLDDAHRLEAFAARKGMARLSFWSLARDNGGCPGQPKADPSCSGLPQPPWAFSRVFAWFARDRSAARARASRPRESDYVCRNSPDDERICAHVGPRTP